MKKARKIRLTPTRQIWAEQRGGATFTGKPLFPPDAVEARYKRALDAMVDRMTRATAREIEKLFKSSAAREAGMTTDASFASMAAKLVKELQRRFNILFSKSAGGLAEALAHGISRQAAVGLGQSLKEVSGGVTLKTDVVSGAVADVVKASVKQNVALIKSIPSKYFLEIEGAVMRSIQTGKGMADLQPHLEKQYGVTKRRAALIARDQTSKATTAINRARMQGLGVKKFKWLHSMGGKEPRPLHKDVLNGNVYSFDDLPVIDEATGERGLPGQLINCFTGSTKVSLTNGCRNLWRYWHEGDIVRIGVNGDVVFEATSNHPVLTGRGWLPAHEIQEGDYLASSEDQSGGVVYGHDAQNTVTFADLYVALVLSGDTKTASASEFNFHGDIPENDVDSVSVEKDLSDRLKTGGAQYVEKLVFSAPDSGGFDPRAAVFGGFLGREFILKTALEGAGEVVGADLVAMAELLERSPAVKGFHRVTKKDIIVFVGHVYTMETDEGWYPVAPTATISKNCRCRMVPVIEFKAEEASE